MTQIFPRKRLFLIDASALIFRAYFAFIRSPRYDRKGNNTSALFGFALSLIDIIEKENPDYLAVAFDPEGGSFRHHEFESYKAQREATPEGILWAFPQVKRLLEALQIPSFEVPDYEADDVIGALALRAEQRDFDVYMVTPDKDFGQLVTPHCYIYKPATKGYEVWGEKEVCAKFGLKHCKQMVDYLALVGDVSDNIPGCKGIGAKGAAALLQEFDSLDQIYAHLDAIKPLLRKKLEEGKELTYQSQYLARIRTDFLDDFDLEQLMRKAPDEARLHALLEEFEFKSMGKRLFKDYSLEAPIEGGLFASVNPIPVSTESVELEGDSSIAPSTPLRHIHSLEDTSHHYRLVRSVEERALLWKRLAECSQFAFDTETDGLDTLTATIVGASFSPEEGEAYYLPLPSDFDQVCSILLPLDALMRNRQILKIAQNAKFDQKILARYGISAPEPLFDTLVAGYIVSPDGKHSLDAQALKYLDYVMISYSELSDKKDFDIRRDVPEQRLADYASEDADITRRLYPILRKELQDREQTALFEEIEMPLVGVLDRMEREGVRLDTDRLKEVGSGLLEEQLRIEEEIYRMAGHEFNISSPKQVGSVLFEELKVTDKPRKTSTGAYATSEEVLLMYVDRQPIIQKILDYRGVKKLRSTYIDALPKLVYPDGKLHTSYNQTVATTGRLSSSDPNLQNIPIRTTVGQEIRSAFVARDRDYTFLSADYSQIELRLMAHFSGDEHLIRAFVDGEDIHRATAARIYRIDPEEVTALQRSHAKTANFGIIYGISAFGLSQRLHISNQEAKQLIDSYFASYPRVKQYMDECIQKAQGNGYASTLLNRRRYIPDINSRTATVRAFAQRNAINAPIQGTAADMIKIAMVRIDAAIRAKNMKSRMIMQVHDELNFDAYHSEIEELKSLVREEMCQAIPNLRVPIVVEIGTGENWLEAH